MRQNRPAGGSVERAHYAQQDQHRIDRSNRMPAAHRNKQQEARAERVSRIASAQHLAAIEAVGRVSGNQKQQDARKKLRQPDQPEIKRALRDVVNLPSHGNSLHFDSGHNQEASNLKQHEVRMRKSDASSSGVVRRGHEHLMCHRQGKTCTVQKIENYTVSHSTRPSSGLRQSAGRPPKKALRGSVRSSWRRTG